MSQYKPKTFWQKPEGVTGVIFLLLLLGGSGLLLATVIPPLAVILESTALLVTFSVITAGLLYVLFDPKMRALIGYGYKSIMRWITGLFVEIDPIGILKSYVEDLHDKLRHMNKQINKLRGQMHQLAEMMYKNKKQIQSNLELAKKARDAHNEQMMVLKSRKAGRLKDSNMRLDELYKKMEVLYRVITRMYANSEILAEDIKDQVELKEQERKAIHASNSAMKSAMKMLQGDPDKRAMFDQALEAIADDVGNKMGEMERLMEVSANFMDSIDLQNGVFEEEGLEMMEKWEKESMHKLFGIEESKSILMEADDSGNVLDLNEPIKRPERAAQGNQYDSFFD